MFRAPRQFRLDADQIHCHGNSLAWVG
jgi:hypothetical protein